MALVNCLAHSNPILRRDILEFHVNAATLPPQGPDYSLLVEIAPTAAGPWTIAPLYVPATNLPDPNPTTLAANTADQGYFISPLTHNTTYFVRTTVSSTPGDVPLEAPTVCGPFTTANYPTLVCDPTVYIPDANHSSTTWQVGLTQGPGGGFLNGDDTYDIVYGTTPGGPYPNALNGGGLSQPPFTGLTPSTTYYYRARLHEVHETNGIYATSPECQFTTLAAPVSCLPPELNLRRDVVRLHYNASGLTDFGSAYQLLIEQGPSAAGPWTASALFQPIDVPTANPTSSVRGADETTVVGLLTHGSTHFYRLSFALDLNSPDPSDAQIICGPYTQGAYPTAVCDPAGNGYPFDSGALGHSDTAWQLFNVFTGNLQNGDDQIQVRYGTTPGGPYPLSTPLTSGVVPQITGLAPNTQYYYRVDAREQHETNGVFSTSPECTFKTFATPVVAPTPLATEIFKLCTQVNTVGGYCIAGAPVLLHVVASSDGDIIPVGSTEFPAPAGHGVFSTIGFFRSYYADLNGGLVTGTATACATGIELDQVITTESGCAGGVPFTRRTTRTVNNTTGATAATVVDYVDSVNVSAAVAPAGFVLGACPDATAITSVAATCAAVAQSALVFGPELLQNGNFEQSTGVLGSSVPGPGWTTGYTVPSGGNLFAGAGAGTSTMLYFSGLPGTAFNGSCPALSSIGNKALGVNVGPSLTTPIIEWQNIFLETGKSYRLGVTAAVIIFPFGVSIALDGVNFLPVTPPTTTCTWTNTNTDFTLAQPTGYYRVGLQSNNGAAAGNDHAFDNISLREISPAVAPAPLTARAYTETSRVVIDQVVQTAGCADDRRDKILAAIADNIIKSQSAYSTVTTSFVRSDVTAAGTVAAGAGSVTFLNVGTTNATVAGGSLLPGESITINAYEDPATRTFNRTPAIAYTASGTAILHISVQL